MSLNKRVKTDYKYLVEKSKKEVLLEMGEEYNFFPSDVWTYTLNRIWIIKSKVLFVYFKDNKVVNVEIKNCYGKFST
jgi:hypothetical protein